MRSLIGWGAGGAVVAVAMLAAGYQLGRQPQPAAAPPVQEAALDKDKVELIVRDYLVDNPEILLEMQASYEAKQREEQRLAALGTISSSAEAIFKAPTDAVVGNPDGKTTIVEFYDYNCGFCKRAMGDMMALTKTDPDLRFVLKELPILGPDSEKAHIVSQAFHRLMPQKYSEFHLKLLGGEGRATEDTALQLAASLGADLDALKAEMAKPEVQATLAGNRQLAESLQINGTPSYVVGDEVVFGALGEQALAEKIAGARAQCQTAAC